MQIKAVLFDLDGTILYTNDLIVNSFQFTLKKILGLTITREEIVECFGEPLYKTLGKYSSERLEELVKTYREYNLECHDSQTKIFPDVISTLKILKNSGYKLGIVTSKINQVALRGLELFDLIKYFDCFVGANDTAKHKPDPEPLLIALDRLRIQPENAIYVGDSPYDLLCGRNAKTLTAAVEYSEYPLERLIECNPNYILKNLSDITQILEK